MRPELSTYAIISLMGAAQALLLSLALFAIPRGNRLANRLLAGIAAVCAVAITAAVLTTSKYLHVYPQLLLVHNPLEFAGIPLLFFYAKSATDRGWRFVRWDLLHFLPALACFLYLLPFYFSNRASKLAFLKAAEAGSSQYHFYKALLLLALGVLYLTLIARVLYSHARNSRQESALHYLVRSRGKVVLGTVAVLSALGIFRVLAMQGYFANLPVPPNLLLPLALTLLVYSVGFLALRQPQVLTEFPEAPARKYEKSTLSMGRAELLLEHLMQLMKEKRPFLDGNLSLQRLARELAVSPHHLSQLLNERLNQNFFDFVNSYRVEEAKRMLLDPAFRGQTVVTIGESVGFNSKSAFNAAFKRLTGATPSEFRRE